MKKALAIISLLLVANCTFAETNFIQQQDINTSLNNQTKQQDNNYKLINNTLKGSVITVPAGESFKAVVTAPISSETAVTGQNVTLALGSDFYYNNNK